MKQTSLFLAGIVMLTSCVSTTLIESVPSGAEVYIDSQKAGVTPYTYKSKKIAGSKTSVFLKKEGYQDLEATIVRNERPDGWPIAGSVLLVPLFWVMKYDPVHSYEMIALPNTTTQTNTNGNNSTNNGSGTNNNATVINNKSSDELIKLKMLFDKEAINNDEYTLLKASVLNNTYSYTNSIADQLVKLKNLLDSNAINQDEYNAQKSKLIYGK